MASKAKMSTIRVAVCGLTSSCYNGLGGQGPGKSCLCNRLIQPTHDKLYMDHTSVLNLSEFGSTVINNTHFLYWGEKISVLEDGQEVKFQIVEHTEFVDDSSLKPFSTTKPYHKRCIQVKLQSGGKVTFLEPNQLALPEHYTNVPKFPDKFTVDGFIVCVDVSTKFDDPSDPQKEFFHRLLEALLATKKPVVVACTKFDRAKLPSVMSVTEMVTHSKKQLPVVEVSALKGVNVDACFLVLAHLVDPKKPKTRIVPYADSKTLLDERIRRNEEAFQYVLDERLTDFSMSLQEASECLKPIVEYQILIDLCGQDRVNKLIRATLRYLKMQIVKSKTHQFVKTLPHILIAMLPVVEVETTPEVAKTKLRRSSKFERYFVDVENWRENSEFLKSVSEDVIPFGILEEDPGQDVLGSHIDEILVELRARAAAEKIKNMLHNTTDILPGVDMTMLWVDLGLSDDVKRISNEEQVHIYNEYMGKLEQECVADLTELFLEKSDLFDEISSSPKDTFDRVHQELKDIPRYKRLDHRSQLRMSQALKHIGSLQMPEKSPAYSKSGLQDAVEALLGTGMLSQEMLWPGARGEGPCWEMNADGRSLRLCILARTEANTKILRSDFMNHFSGSGEVDIGDQIYKIDISLEHGHHIHSLNTNNFLPHGAVAVVTSLECVDWLKDVVQRLWLFEVGRDKPCHAPCRGMPLIVLALDKDAMQQEGPSKPTSAIHTRSQAVAAKVQCVCLAETPTTQPMRLVGSPVINQMLLSLVNAFAHLDTFLTSKVQLKDPTGFNIAVCTLVGDPYPNESLLHPLLQHQLIFCDNDDHTLFLKCAIEKQHRTCVFTFNSMFNVSTLCNSIHLGFILIYSTQRPASLAVLKYLLSKLPNIPKLIVAMTTSQSHDKTLLVEGQEVAKECKAMFLSNTEEELSAGFAMEFLHRCWFRRFTSWQVQRLTDDARHQLKGKQTRALPDRPTFRSVTPTSLPPPPPAPTITPNRHSMGTILDRIDTRTSPGAEASSNTLPRSPIKPSYLSKLASEDSDIYSDPVVSKIGKKATIERKKKTSLPISPPFLSPPHALSPVNLPSADLEQSDYASVEDAVKLSALHAGMVESLRRQPRRSPSMSPPPPPFSPPILVPLKGVGEEPGVEPDVYDTVEASQRKVTSPTGKGYDHLPADDSPPTKGYDHLVSPPRPPRPPRTDLSPKTRGDPSGKYAPLSSLSGGRDPAPPPPPSEDVEREAPMYATIDVVKPKKKASPPEPPISTIPNRSSSPAPAIKPRTKPRPPNQKSVDDGVRSTRNKPSPPFGHQRIKSDDLSLRSSTSKTSNIEQMYSVVQKKPHPHSKPRRAVTPEEPMYSVPEKRKPPPIAPKPSSRSPTPTSERRRDGTREHMEASLKVPGARAPGLTHMRSESFDTGMLTYTSAFRPDLMRTGRSHSLNQQQKIKVIPLRSPSPEIKTFSSLPSSYRNRAKLREVDIQRTRSKEELPQRERSPKFTRGSHSKSREHSPKLTRGVQPGPLVDQGYGQEPPEVDWEEDAPPLPARNYSWSDIEDNDEDIWQSDDDLDDEPMNAVTIMEHQQLYSTIRRLSIHTPNTIEAIYNVVNRIQIPAQPSRDSLLMDSSRSQWLPQVAEEAEQVYDTLENMVSSISQPATAATTSHPATTPWPEERASATPTKLMESMPLTPRDIKLIKQQQKLLQKLQKKVEKEGEQRRRQDEKKRRRDEEMNKKERRKFGKKGKYQKPAVNECTRYFGSPLAKAVENDGVPAFVRKCVEMIEGTGMTSVGLYRVSGKKEDCLALQDKFDQDQTLDITSLGFYSSCISSTLKAFFKLLPEPLISNDIASQLLVINSLDAESQRTRIHEILEGMARPNLCTFHFMMQHLYKVQCQQNFNKMTASNLAIVFWPTLIRPPLMDLADSGKQMGWQLVMSRIIEHPDFVPVVE